MVTCAPVRLFSANLKEGWKKLTKSREAAKQSGKDFSNDPDWKKARTESEVNGKLTEKVESVFMAATDYSPVK